MQLDREDDVLTGSHGPHRALDPSAMSAPSAWFTQPASTVAVIVKKRRTLGIDGAASGPSAFVDSASDADERRPRVFVMPREPVATATAGDTPSVGQATALSTMAEAPPVRRRRRRLPEQRPSAVVHIVMPAPPTAPAASPDEAGADAVAGFVLDLPSLEAWRELQSALAGVRRLVQDAEHASRWELDPAPKTRRPRG